MSRNETGARRLGQDDTEMAVDVLHESFFDYPVMTYVLGERAEYSRHLRQLIGFFVETRLQRREVLLGMNDETGLAGVAMVSYPDGRESPPAVGVARERLWAELGSDARRRYELFGKLGSPCEIDAPHLHLNMIGVKERARGTGLGRQLLEAVHALSATDPWSTGVTLTTEVPSNVRLYEHFGYQQVGKAEIKGHFTGWGFFRADDVETSRESAA